MLSKNKIKFINSLKKKKHRTEQGLFLAEGTKLVREFLHNGLNASLLCATRNWYNNHTILPGAKVNDRLEVTEKELQKISTLKTPPEVLGVFNIPEKPFRMEELSGKLSLVLDQINDPGNLGTIVRLADWFGIEHLICSPHSVDLYNPKTVQSTMGSIARVRVFYRELTEVLEKGNQQMGFNIYGTFLKGENLYTTELAREGFIVMGSESHGISPELHPFINRHIYIPSYPTGQAPTAESLNVSMATGIICSEFRRREWMDAADG
jgi:TrmH family RNA methyltransferase